MTDLEELIKKYKHGVSSMSDRERAETEQQIWEEFLTSPDRPAIGKGNSITRREEYLQKTLGGSQDQYATRLVVWNGMPASKVLWDLIDAKKMLTVTAASIVRVARRIAMEDNVPLDEGIRVALDEYNSRPQLIFVGGIPVRRGAPSKKPAAKAKPEKKAPERHVRLSSKTEEGHLFSRIRNEILTYLDERVSNVEPILKEKLVGEFEVAVKVVVEELRHKMARLVEAGDDARKADQAVSLRHVRVACEALHMDPPQRGHPVDISKAKKQKKMLAREYHPDAHPEELKGRMEEKMHSVLQAFSIIEQYNEQVEPTGKGDRSARDRAEGGGSRG